ncbi:MAG: VWA domain-containing protein [Bacteroidota bacterium]
MCRSLILGLFIAICVLPAMAQLSGDKTMHNFGAINNYNNDTAYFEFTNTSGKVTYLLPTQPREDYQVFCNTKTVAPGETITIGIIYYTSKKGRFSIDVPLYFSHSATPLNLVLKGDIRSIHPNALTICPSIENSKPLNHTVPFNVIVRDKATNAMLKDARVSVKQKKKNINCVPGFRSMAFQCNCEYGPMDVNASHDGYMPATEAFEFNMDNNTCLVYLEKLPEQPHDTIIRLDDKITIEEKVEDKITVVDTTKEEVILYQPVEPKTGEFNKEQYKPNHLIFVIDVSGSMKDSTKLGYLKQSMKALIDILRPEDYITLITYAGKINLVFENVNGISKTQLYEAIDTLTARGGTAGGEAMLMAYKMAREHFIKDGNNQVFLATDGMFSGRGLTEQDLYKLVRNEYLRYGIKLTTIAFGKYPKALEFLAELAQKGRGRSLAIRTLPDDKAVLIEEVKKQSAR